MGVKWSADGRRILTGRRGVDQHATGQGRGSGYKGVVKGIVGEGDN